MRSLTLVAVPALLSITLSSFVVHTYTEYICQTENVSQVAQLSEREN